MKKISRIIAGTLLATGISFAQVQIGGHAAVNFSTLWGDGASEMEIPWSLGVLAGVATKVPVNEKICVVPEMNVDWRRQKDDEITWNTWAIEVPVLARYSVVPQTPNNRTPVRHRYAYAPRSSDGPRHARHNG